MDVRSHRITATGPTFCSIFAKCELDQVRAFAQSVRRHYPNAAVVTLLLDRSDGYFRPELEPFTVISVDDLKGIQSAALRFVETRSELRRLLKPDLLEQLLKDRGTQFVAYFDPDIILTSRLRSVEQLLPRHPMLVGPYLPPISRDAVVSVDQSKCVYCPSFMAVSRNPATTAFFHQWADRQQNATLNLVIDERTTREPRIVDTSGLYERNERSQITDWPYTWDSFDNGVRIPGIVRDQYRTLGAQRDRFGDPFATGKSSYFHWLTSFDGTNIPPLFQLIHSMRSDVQHHYPDVSGRDQAAFLEWVVNHGMDNHRLDPGLLWAVQPARHPSPTRLGHPATESFGVNVLGFLNSEKGVGEASRTTIRAIAAAEIPHALNNWVDAGSSNADTSLTELSTHNPYPVNIIHLNADVTPWLLSKMPGYFRERYNIGFWNWELEWFPEQWHDAFHYYDEVWAPSVFTQQSIARVAPFPVYLVPYAITAPPPSRPEMLRRERFGLPRDAFVFLFAFDFHSYFARKNPVATIEAFRRAFGTRRDVHLLLKSSRADAAPREFAEVLTASRGQPNIHIMRDVLPRDEMHALLRVCDAYVALHRSEGFGLPLAEAMALGKPVVATDYSANVDFMNETNSFPVQYRMVAIEEDHGPYLRGKLWADPDVEHAAEQMRRVVEYPAQTARIAACAREDIERMLSPKVVGRTIRARLESILLGNSDHRLQRHALGAC